MILKRITILFFLLALITSCGSRKNITTKKSKKTTKVVVKSEDQEVKTPSSGNLNLTEQYIKNYTDVAKEKMRQYGIPASITLAQGILESGSGKGTLAVKANNHFGIKCHDWTGAKVYHDDDEKGECFRKYKDAKYSFQDHSVFLTSRKRYHKLFNLDKDDYKAWAKELKAAGYATDKKYPQKLISLIERYKLYTYDAEVLGKPVVEKIDQPQEGTIKAVEEVKHIVVKGDTLYSLSKRYHVTVDDIKTLNSLESNDISIGQELIIKF